MFLLFLFIFRSRVISRSLVGLLVGLIIGSSDDLLAIEEVVA